MDSTVRVESEPAAQEKVSVQQTLFARFMLPDTTEHGCRVKEIDADGAIFLVNLKIPPRLSIVAYVEEVGRVEGITGETVEGGFRVAFKLSGARRERFEGRLRWLSQKERQPAPAEAERRHTRFEPTERQSQITLPDGREYPCEVMDISLSGAAVKVDVMPSLGTYLLLGKMRGRVVRYHEDGIAIEFLKLLDRGQLNDSLR
ncbi:PilZ domain-containing protein [Aestuariivirga sp.]|uniref:PilZ domain-containing protein n=1 Tax=Aestuariivirga sp. TaxID=2650926 RepID=UPI00391A2EF9